MKLPMVLLVAVCAGPVFATDFVFDGVIADRPNKWDSYPAHMFVGDTHVLWWCGTSGFSGSINSLVDGIFRASRTGSLGPGGWSTPVEVLNHTQTPLATNHVCDPTVVLGEFQYESLEYSHLLLCSYDDDQPPGGDNGAEGAAFSNDGISWVAVPAASILPDFPFDGSYGAGAGSLGWGANLGVLNHIYTDTTRPESPWETRYKYSSNGYTFEPTPSLPNSWVDGLVGLDIGADSAVAYSPFHQRWFGAARTIDNEFDGEIIIISTESPSIGGPWFEVGRFNHQLTGVEFNNNPEFARKADSTLLIDEAGFAYILFGAWPVGQALQGKVYQVRMSLAADLPRIGDSFQHVGVSRTPWAPLAGTQTELAAREWQSNGTVAFGSSAGYVTNSADFGSHVAGVPFALSEVPGQQVSVEADLHHQSGGWVAIGFAPSETAGLFSGGGIWALINNTQVPQVEVFENGLNQLAVVPLPNPDSEFNHLRIEYEPTAGQLAVRANGIVIASGLQLGFVPSIGAASIHLESATGGSPVDGMRVGGFLVNNPHVLLFRDGFEVGSSGRWSATCPPNCD